MAQIKYDTTLRITDTSDSVNTVTSTKTVTYTAKEDKEYSIASLATQSVWNISAESTEAIEAVGSIDFMYIVSDKDDVLLELTGDVGGDTTDINIVKLMAGVPFTLGSDDTENSYADVTGFLHASSAAQDIERIRVQNNNASTATVRVIIVT